MNAAYVHPSQYDESLPWVLAETAKAAQGVQRGANREATGKPKNLREALLSHFMAKDDTSRSENR